MLDFVKGAMSAMSQLAKDSCKGGMLKGGDEPCSSSSFVLVQAGERSINRLCTWAKLL